MIFYLVALIGIGLLGLLFFSAPGKRLLASIKAAEEKQKACIQKARDELNALNDESLSDVQIPRISQILSDLEETKSYWGGSRVLLSNRIREELYQFSLNLFQRISPSSGLHKRMMSLLANSHISTEKLYQLSLLSVESHPRDSKSKQLALETGRMHFSKTRGGKVTIYDEQAIQNDIQVRSQ